MTIICCLPSLPVEVFWHLLTPLQRYISAYATPRDEPPQLAAVLGQEPSDYYALTGACFHAGEIRVLDSSRSFESQTQSVFHRHAQRNSSRRRDARQESRLPHCRSRGAGTPAFSKRKETDPRFLLFQALVLRVFG